MADMKYGDKLQNKPMWYVRAYCWTWLRYQNGKRRIRHRAWKIGFWWRYKVNGALGKIRRRRMRREIVHVLQEICIGFASFFK